MSTSLERVLARFRRQPNVGDTTSARISAGAFRAAVEERLRNLEREMTDLKGRLNGLIFLVAGAVVVDVVIKLAR